MFEVVFVVIAVIIVLSFRRKWESECEPDFETIVDPVVRTLIEIEYAKKYVAENDIPGYKYAKEPRGEEWVQLAENVMKECGLGCIISESDRIILRDRFRKEAFKGVINFINNDFKIGTHTTGQGRNSKRKFNIVRKLES